MGKLYTSLSGKKRIQATKEKYKTLYSWTSRDRFWEPKSQEWFLGIAIVFIIVVFVAVILGQLLLAGALVALLFLLYSAAITTPNEATHIITRLGIRTFGKFLKWDDIAFFWFSEKKNVKFLHLDVFDRSVENRISRVTLLVENGEEQDIFDLLIERVSYGEKSEAGINILDRVVHGKHIPIGVFLPEDFWASEEDEYEYLNEELDETDDLENEEEVVAYEKKKISKQGRKNKDVIERNRK